MNKKHVFLLNKKTRLLAKEYHLRAIWEASGRLQEASGDRRLQEASGGSRRLQEAPGSSRKLQEAPGGSGRQKVIHLSAIMQKVP